MFEQDVRKAYTEGGVTPVPTGGWGNKEQKTACPMMAAYLLHHNYQYPARGVKVGQWVIAHYGMSRDYGQGVLLGYDNRPCKTRPIAITSEADYEAGFQLGKLLAAEYKG